jgi:hypothetical protein
VARVTKKWPEKRWPGSQNLCRVGRPDHFLGDSGHSRATRTSGAIHYFGKSSLNMTDMVKEDGRRTFQSRRLRKWDENWNV